jgi:hypothetical protein
MKVIKGLFIIALLLGGIGYAGYYFVNKFVEDKAVEYVEEDLAGSSDLDMARDYVNNSPTLKAYISEGANADLNELPFQTREEATRAVMKKLSLQEMQMIQSKAADGMSEEEAMELISTFEDKMTEEELLALKAIVYRELYQ